MIGTLKSELSSWEKRPLAEIDVVSLPRCIALRVRMDKRVTSVPVLVALAVLTDGQKQLVAMEMCANESHEAWKGFLADLLEVAQLVHRAPLNGILLQTSRAPPIACLLCGFDIVNECMRRLTAARRSWLSLRPPASRALAEATAAATAASSNLLSMRLLHRENHHLRRLPEWQYYLRRILLLL